MIFLNYAPLSFPPAGLRRACLSFLRAKGSSHITGETDDSSIHGCWMIYSSSSLLTLDMTGDVSVFCWRAQKAQNYEVVVKNLHDCDTFYLLFIRVSKSSRFSDSWHPKRSLTFSKSFSTFLRIRIYSGMKFIAADWSVDMRDGRFERANSADPNEAFTANEIVGSSRAGGCFKFPWRWINIY